MKKKFVFIFFVFANSIHAQTVFQKTYGGPTAVVQISCLSAQETADNGFIAGCYSFATGSFLDIYLIKTNSMGDTLWTRSFDFGGEDMCRSVHQTSDGGYILTGFGVGLYLLKTDNNGNFLWAKSYGAGEGYSVIQTSDGGYIFTGKTNMFTNPDVFIAKTDSSGNLQWMKNYGGTGSDWGNCIRKTIDGGYIMVGTTQSFGAGAGDVLVIKTDSNGAALWDKTYGGIGDEEGYYVQQTSDGGYVLSGYDKTSTLGYLVKTNISGNLIWSKTYLYGSAYIVQQTSDGGYIMIDRFDAGLRKVDNSGNLLWAKSYPVNTSPLAHSGQITSHGGFFLAGYIKDASGSRAYLIKTDSLGNSECANNLSITASNAATQVTSPALTVVNINPVVTPQTLTVSGGVNVATPCAVGTDELDKRENNFLLFPNPVANELYVISYTLLDKNAVEVYDALGQKVFSQKLTAKSQQQIINVSKWNSGVYFVKVKTSEGEKTHKLIVQH